MKALEEAVEHATDRYGQGLASYYEVLEAQQQLYPAQNTLAQIRRNRLLAYVAALQGARWRLERVGWQTGQALTAASGRSTESDAAVGRVRRCET